MEVYEERLKKVNLWLEDLLETENVPPFEITEETVKYLEGRKEEQEERERQRGIVRRRMEEENQEFVAEKNRLRGVLSSLELDPTRDLSSAHLNSMSKVASAVECVDPDSVSMAMSLSQFLERRDWTKRELLDEAEIQRQANNGIAEARQLGTDLKKEFSKLEESLHQEKRNAERLSKTILFCNGKQKEYRKLISDCEVDLKTAEFSESVSHSRIQEQSEGLEELERKMRPLRLQLDAYQSLPPDVQRAKLKVLEKTGELKTNEDKLQKLLQNISLNE